MSCAETARRRNGPPPYLGGLKLFETENLRQISLQTIFNESIFAKKSIYDNFFQHILNT